jgi:hypothetical protein
MRTDGASYDYRMADRETKGRPNRCSVLVRRLACYAPNVDFCELGCQRAELPARRQRNRSHEAVETLT